MKTYTEQTTITRTLPKIVAVIEFDPWPFLDDVPTKLGWIDADGEPSLCEYEGEWSLESSGDNCIAVLEDGTQLVCSVYSADAYSANAGGGVRL